MRFLRYFLFVFLVFVFASFVVAEGFAVPSVYVSDIKLEKNVFAAGETVSGSFVVESGEPEALSDIGYSVGLVQKYTDDNAAEVFVNEINSPEKFFLQPGEKSEKSFTYKIPKNLAAGRYGLRVQIVTGKGSPLGWQDYFIDVEKGGNFILLTNPWVIDEGERYDAGGGRSFDKDETPIIEFKAANLSSEQISAEPAIKIFRRHTNLELLKIYEEKEIVLGAEEEKIIQYPLPKMETPEAYFAELVLRDKNGAQISNITNFRWVISGMSAEILSLVSPPPSKSDCDIQRVLVDYVGPADSGTSGGNAILAVKIADNGEIIGQAQKDIQLQAGSAEFAITTNRCVETPQITAEIIKDGIVLDSYTITQPPRPASKFNLFSKDNLIILAAIFIILLAALIIKKFLKKNVSVPPAVPPAVIFLLVTAGSILYFSLPSVVLADAVVTDSGPVDGTIIAWNSPRHNSVYKSGETFITFSGRIWIGSCANSLIDNKITFYITDKNGGNRVTLGTINPPDYSNGRPLEYNQSFLFPEVGFEGEGRAYIEFRGRHGTEKDKHWHWITAYEHFTVAQKMKNRPPTAVCGSPSNLASNSATLNWSYADLDRDYQGNSQLQVAKDSNFINLIYNQFILSNVNSALVGNLNLNEKYYWRVRVSDNQGSVSNWSDCGGLDLSSRCRVEPLSASIRIGDKAQYRAYYDPDGDAGPAGRQDVTNTAVWNAANKGIALVNKGLVTGVGVGFTQIQAKCAADASGRALAVVYSALPGGEGVCGNGVAEGGEQCDGADLKGFTCNSLGYIKGGVLRCANNCVFDITGCIYSIKEQAPR